MNQLINSRNRKIPRRQRHRKVATPVSNWVGLLVCWYHVYSTFGVLCCSCAWPGWSRRPASINRWWLSAFRRWSVWLRHYRYRPFGEYDFILYSIINNIVNRFVYQPNFHQFNGFSICVSIFYLFFSFLLLRGKLQHKWWGEGRRHLLYHFT